MGWHISIHTFVGTFIPVDVTYGPITVGGMTDLKHLPPIAIDKGHPPPEGHAERRENPFERHPVHIDLKKKIDEIRDRLNRDRPKPEDHPPQPEDNNSDDNSDNNSGDEQWQWDATDEHFKDYAAPGARSGGGGGGG
ncbi:MAG TPA: hypothetical protein VGJ37_05490 [Pyrinomonadaceae bacterium]|jgi:hypothetical protein